MATSMGLLPYSKKDASTPPGPALRVWIRVFRSVSKPARRALLTNQIASAAVVTGHASADSTRVMNSNAFMCCHLARVRGCRGAPQRIALKLRATRPSAFIGLVDRVPLGWAHRDYACHEGKLALTVVEM